MKHSDLVVRFFVNRDPNVKEIDAYFECDTCYAAVGKAQYSKGVVKFKCPNGHENAMEYKEKQ